MQRIRVKFSRTGNIRFISHLDMVRLWERAFRRAGVPLAYSQGFSPHPQISSAVPLSVGMTSEAEVMDVFCTRNVTGHWFIGVVNQQLPDGIRVLQASLVPLLLPALQAQVRFAEYRVEIATVKSRDDVEKAVAGLMDLHNLPWQHQRDTGVRSYDLRALIDDIWLVEWRNGWVVLGMRLHSDSRGAGRPEQVAVALGFPEYPEIIHRTNLILEVGKPAQERNNGNQIPPNQEQRTSRPHRAV